MENRAEFLIESFFANSLSLSEADELKALITSDPNVAAEFDFQQKVAAQLSSHSLAEGINNTDWKKAAQAAIPATAIKVSLWPRYFLAAAASIALLIVGYLYLMPPNLQNLVADNAKEYPNKMKFKTFGDEALAVPPDVIQAFASYDKQEYGEAAKALAPIVATYADRMDYRLYWGVSLIKNKQYGAAVTALTPIVNGQSEQRTPALFYLGLACAASGDKACAQQNLQAYIDSPEGVSFRTQAQIVKEAL